MTRKELRAELHAIANELSTQPIEFEVRRAAIKDFASRGEYFSNIAIALAAKIKDDPQRLAEKIKESWRHRDVIVSAHGGFLNFQMTTEALQRSIQTALDEGRDYGTSTLLRGQRINVEFVSADPTGPLTLQHGRIATCGDALCRLLEFCGASVTREYFLNDIETAPKLRLLGESVAALYLEHFGQNASAPEGAVRDGFTRQVAQELASLRGNALLLLPEAERIAESTHAARETAVAGHRSTLKKFRVHFDVWSSESTLRRDRLIDAMIETLRERGHVYEKDGATWLRTTNADDDADRPLVRGGEYTYLAADIAYHAYRYERDFDRLINIWTSEHRPYVQRTHAALQLAGFNADSMEVLLCEDAALLRDGEPVQIEENAAGLDDALGDVEAETLRFLLLLADWSTPADVETEIAARDDENNRAYAARLLPSRLSTLLREAQAKHQGHGASWSDAEKQLARMVAVWPDDVEKAARERRPQWIAHLVLAMSQSVQSLLAHKRSDQNLSPQLLRAAQITANNALRILGIEPCEKF